MYMEGMCSRAEYMCMLSHSVLSDSLWPHGWLPTKVLCPWNFPGKNTGASCHFLFQGIFLTQEYNQFLLHLLHQQADSLPLVPPGKPTQLRRKSKCPICMNSKQAGDPRTELSRTATFTNRGEQSMPSALRGPEGGGSPGGFVAKKIKSRDCSKRGEWWPGSKAESKEEKVLRDEAQR